MFFIIYKISNLINGRYYIGKHATTDINDDYMGSGLLITRAIKKYGKHQFKKEILFVFDNSNLMELKEKEIITEEMLLDPLCYNLALGGQGGNLGENINKRRGQTMSKILLSVPKTEEHKKNIGLANKGKTRSDDFKNNAALKTKERMAQMKEEERKKVFGHCKESNGFYGKKHSKETIEKIRKNKLALKGLNHPCLKPVTIDGITYPSRKECMAVLGISKTKLYRLIGEN